jgi:hypothetical protein
MFPSLPTKYNSRNPWWILVVWILAVPGIRPIVHQHEQAHSTACEALRLEKHLTAFEHSADTNEDHLHWVFSLDGSVATPLPNGTWINGPCVSIPIDAIDEASQRSLHQTTTAWEFALCELLLHQSPLNTLSEFKNQRANSLGAFEGRDRISDACNALSLFCIARQ